MTDDDYKFSLAGIRKKTKGTDKHSDLIKNQINMLEAIILTIKEVSKYGTERQINDEINRSYSSIKSMIKGNFKFSIEKFKSEMLSHSKNLEFEKAQKLKEQISDPTMWENNSESTSIMKKISFLEKDITLRKNLVQKAEDVEVLFEFLNENQVEEDEVEKELNVFSSLIKDFELKLLSYL